MMNRSRRRYLHGFSLIELALVLAILGVLGTVFWQFLPRIKSLPMIAKLSAPTLIKAEEALNGYALVNSRLPCPDTTGSGFENCLVASGMPVPLVGWLPSRTLGLSLSERVRYGVYRAPVVAPASVSTDGDLAALKDRFQPLLPPGVTSIQSNGLDFCVALRNLVAAPGTVLTADITSGITTGGPRSVPIAYGLAVAGATDADGDGSPFDGLNVAAGKFAAGTTPRSNSYDDQTTTVGIGELFTRLGCASRLAEANSAARAAYAAYDIDQFAARYVGFRTFAIRVREMNVQAANVGIAVATADLAISVGNSWSGVALTAVTAGGAGGGVAAAVAAGIAATASLTAAIASKVLANNALTFARSQLPPSQAFKDAAASDFVQASARATSLDQKGLLP